jgi:DNA-binding SARP family transcriptional activator
MSTGNPIANRKLIRRNGSASFEAATLARPESGWSTVLPASHSIAATAKTDHRQGVGVGTLSRPRSDSRNGAEERPGIGAAGGYRRIVLLGVLGPLELRGTAAPGPPRDRVVLSALVVRRGSVVPADVLADALWNESPPRTWPKVVQGSVVRLRKTLGADAVGSVQGGYRLDVPRGQLDLDVFQELIEQARMHRAAGDHARAFVEFGDGLRLWRGTALPDALEWPPGCDESRRLDELHQTAEEDRVETGVAIGRARDLVPEARRLADEHPERERRWIVLATALYGAGRQVEALDVVREAIFRLRDFYGLDPGPDLAELERSMLRQDGSLPRALATPTASLECPYPGLMAYSEHDASLFAGRDDDICACLERLGSEAVLVVSGASGSGKSSLVHAGLHFVVGRRRTTNVPIAVRRSCRSCARRTDRRRRRRRSRCLRACAQR